MRRKPCSSEYSYAHWSHIGLGCPWQHTDYWQPPTEPGRIAALEQRVAGLLRAQDQLIAAMANRLESLEQLFWAHKHEAKPVSTPADHQP
jgi:hypothetical protein